MKTSKITLKAFVSEQVKRLEDSLTEGRGDEEIFCPVITLNMQAGSLGRRVGKIVAERLRFDFFHHEILDRIARIGKVDKEMLSYMEKERYTGLSDFVSCLLEEHYIHPNTYLRYLHVVVRSLARLGRAVIVGRGGNYILKPEKRFSVRVLAPMEVRIQNVVEAFEVSRPEAEKRIRNRGAKRTAFIKESFGKDIMNPQHYDLTINMGKLDVESAADAVIGGYLGVLASDRFHEIKK